VLVRVEDAAQEQRRTLALATLGLIGACFFWGLGFPLTKAYALRAQVEAPGASSWFVMSALLAVRFLAAAACTALFLFRRPRKLELEQGLWLGVFTGAGLVFQADGMAYTEASTSAFLTQGYVLFLPVVSAVAGRRFPEARVIVAVVAIVLGLTVLARFDPHKLALGRGELETLIASMLFGLQILWLSREKYAQNRTAPVTLIFFLVIGAGTLPLAWLTARPSDIAAIAGSAEVWVLFTLLTLLSTLVAFGLMNRSQPHVPPAEAGVIYGAEPLFASAFALFLPEMITPLAGITYENEALTSRLLIGGGLVTIANLVLQLRAGRPRPEANA
jgi:drug/metabolite transporter (DMT)-like permease